MPDRVPLTKVKVRIPPQPGLINILKDLLARAEKGELQSCAFACVYANDLEPGGMTSDGWSVASYTNFAMSHAILQLQMRWAAYVIEKEHD